MKTAFEEIGYLAVTFADGGCQAAKVCKVSAGGTAAPCADGDKFCGIAQSIRGGHVGVQLEGFVQVDYTGSAPGVGYVSLCADGSGGVKAGSGREYLVVHVDSTAKTAVIKL